MGWTGTHYDKTLDGGLRGFFEKQFNCENEYGVWKILDFASVKYGRECYLAVRHRNKTTGEEGVYGAVIICQFSNDYHNITYKEMGESSGPYACDCPERILKQLTPLTPKSDPSGYARKWREECWRRVNARKANRGKFKVGDVLTFARPMKFTDGRERDTFTVIKTKPLRFRTGRDAWGGTVRISRSVLADSSAYTVERG